MSSLVRVSTGTEALTQTYAAIALALAWTSSELGLITLGLTGVVGAPTKVTWYLSTDAAGDEPITPVQTDTLVGSSLPGLSGVARTILVPFNGATIYAHALLDAGSATGIAVLTYTQVA